MIKNNIVYSNFAKWRFYVAKAKGEFIWDTKGNKYIDFTSGWNVVNLGWNQPEITEALAKQAKKNNYVSAWSSNSIQDEYAKALVDALPKGLNTVVRVTGGTEANEQALKISRLHTKRKVILGFDNTYHGNSQATLAVVGKPNIEYPRKRKNKSDSQVLGDFEEVLEKALSKRDVAAVVTEAGIVTGGGSTYVAPKGYLRLLRKITKKYGTLMILDEVGTGFSRCGKLFGMEIENVVPDIVTFAKGISNGAAAIGAMVAKRQIAQRVAPKASIYSTFGWIPTACAVALKTLEIHKRDKVWEKGKKDGEYMMKVLAKEFAGNSSVVAIRGIGMEIGVELKKSKYAVKAVVKAQGKGLHLVCDTDRNIQLMPPLTISRPSLDKGIDILVSTINKLS